MQAVYANVDTVCLTCCGGQLHKTQYIAMRHALILATASQRAEPCADMQSHVPQQYSDKQVTAWQPGNSPASPCTKGKGLQHCSECRQTWVLAKHACTPQLLLRHAAAEGGRHCLSESAVRSSIWKSTCSSLALNCLIQAAGYLYTACMTKARMTRSIRSNSLGEATHQ